MHYRTLGCTGLKVSVVGLGTWQFGGEWGKQFAVDEVRAMLEAARDAGINLIDTAECYGDHLSERLVGEAIAGERDRWVIATKFGHRFRECFQRDAAWQPADVVRQLEDSLRALRTDYVDLYQFHSGPDEAFDTPGLWETLAAEQAKGRIRHLGVSLGANTNLHQTGRTPEVGAGAVQVVYNRLDRKPEDTVFPLCRRHNLGVLARVPLASGFLSGKYRRGAAFPADDVREVWMKSGRDRLLDEVRQIAAAEVPDGVPMARWALAWCLRHPAVTCVIPGCKSVEQVIENAAAAGLDIRQAEHPQAA
jgi:aryl-alcohol dehydrogenase-like predicted oxidoreductase